MLSTIALDTQVIKPGLCTGCGACQGMCPYWDSVEGRTLCYFDCERRSGRCQSFCPRMPVDLDARTGCSTDSPAVFPRRHTHSPGFSPGPPPSGHSPVHCG